jgi:hypothetical protein
MIRRFGKNWLLAIIAQVIFIAYLFCPIDAGQIRPDGTVIYVRGLELVVMTLFPTGSTAIGNFLFYVFFLPVNLSNLLLAAFPFLLCKSWLQKNWARFCLAIIIIFGAVEYSFLFIEPGQSGTWLWLSAAVLATADCLISINYQAASQFFKKRFWLSKKTIGICSTAVLFAGLLCFFSYKIYYGEILGDERESLISPDGHYKIVVLARGVNFFAGAPGDAGGVPGNVLIIDLKSGKRIDTETLEMVYFADQYTWSATNVSIVDVGQWELPSGKFNPIW